MHTRTTAEQTVAGRKALGQYREMVDILDQSLAAWEEHDFWLAFALDNYWEDCGGNADDRSTCWTHQTWSEDCKASHA